MSSDDIQAPDELTLLKKRADQISLSYHPSIGVEKLKAKLNERLAGQEAEAQEVEAPAARTAVVKPESNKQRIARLRKEASRLVRIRLTCMNPSKKEWSSEVFKAGNSTVGSFTRTVPFNAEEGWHVEQMILNVLKERKFQQFKTVKDDRGNKMRKGFQVPEFAIQELPPLSSKELDDLAKQQAMAGTIN